MRLYATLLTLLSMLVLPQISLAEGCGCGSRELRYIFAVKEIEINLLNEGKRFEYTIAQVGSTTYEDLYCNCVETEEPDFCLCNFEAVRIPENEMPRDPIIYPPDAGCIWHNGQHTSDGCQPASHSEGCPCPP